MAAKRGERHEDTADGTFASPCCYMHEIDPGYACPVVDPRQARDAARWRKARRPALIGDHLAIMDWIVTGGKTPAKRRDRAP
jgi:hypothetical protein